MKKSIILAVIFVGILGLAGHFWSVEKAARESLAQELRDEKMRLADALDKLNRTSDVTTVYKAENVKLQEIIDSQAAGLAGLKNDLSAQADAQEQQWAAIGNMEKMLIAARTENEQQKLAAARTADQAVRDRLAKTEAEDKLGNVQKELVQLRADYERWRSVLPKGVQPPEELHGSPNAAQIAEAAALKVEVAQTRGELNQLRLNLARDYAALAELKTELALLAGAGEPRKDSPQTLREAYEALSLNWGDWLKNQEAALAFRDRSLRLTLAETIMFPPGRASLTPEGQRGLETLISALSELPGLNVMVVGHTDNQAPRERRDRQLESGWELSAARAGAAAKYLENSGRLKLGRLEAVGRSSSEPVASNDTPEGRRRNNRVELIITEL